MKHYNIPFNLDDYNNGGYTVETAGYDKPETVCGFYYAMELATESQKKLSS